MDPEEQTPTPPANAPPTRPVPARGRTATLELPTIRRRADLRPASARRVGADAGSRHLEVDCVFSSGAEVVVWPWEPPFLDEPFIEELDMSPGSVRLERFNSGAPVLNVHNAHTWNDQLGLILPGSARVPEGTCRIRFSRREEVAPLAQDVEDGIVGNVSVGFDVHAYRDVTRPDDRYMRLRAVDWEPTELSIAPKQADVGAQVRARNADPQTHPCRIIRGASMDPENENQTGEPNSGTTPTPRGRSTNPPTPTPEPAPRAPAAPRPPADSPAPPAPASEPAVPAAERERIATAERQRIARIHELANRHGLAEFSRQRDDGNGGQRDVLLVEELIGRGVSVDQARGELLDALYERDRSSPTSPTGSGAEVGADPRENVADAIENAISHRLRMRTRAAGTQDWREVELTAHGRRYRHRSLIEIGREILELQGLGSRARELASSRIAELVLSPDLGGYRTRSLGGLHGTDSFANLLANVAHKVLQMAYEANPVTYSEISNRRDFRDFKQTKTVKFGNVPQLLEVPEHGEIKFGTIGEEAESAILRTYARAIGFTRQAMINDDLGAIEVVPADFGEEARQTENRLAWLLVTSNVVLSDGLALFHATHGNLGSGVLDGTATGEASLSAGRTAMRRQVGVPRKDDDGNVLEPGRKLNLVPALLIVPPEKEFAARKQAAATTPANVSDVNTFQGISVLTEAELSNAVEWYFHARGRARALQHGYLDGAAGPQVSSRVGFTRDGTEFKVMHDFGVAVADFRPIYKSSGA